MRRIGRQRRVVWDGVRRGEGMGWEEGREEQFYSIFSLSIQKTRRVNSKRGENNSPHMLLYFT